MIEAEKGPPPTTPGGEEKTARGTAAPMEEKERDRCPISWFYEGKDLWARTKKKQGGSPSPRERFTKIGRRGGGEVKRP